ncbi:MAG: HAMP domain-containing protein [Chloroflexi bacterium]|nr:MAG: HAMP domain-containing protein [Chloroflexota bacterium]
MIQYQSNKVMKSSSFRSGLFRAFLLAALLPVLVVGTALVVSNTMLFSDQLAGAGNSPYGLLGLNVSAAVAAVIIAIIISIIAARRVSDPLRDLADTASRISEGDIELTAEVDRDDEVGILAQAVNNLTLQMRTLIGSLEGRVQERTRELEKQSNYLKATVEVNRAIGSILDLEILTQEVVELIRHHFSMYFVGLFLLSDDGLWAVLRAGTGSAGNNLLTQGHKVEVGTGMVGWSIENNKPRIASEAGFDSIRLGTTELPLTSSEASFPLRSRGRIIGALSVKSEKLTAFDELTISVLQAMADLVATALENARLFKENREALDATRRAYSESTRAAWAGLLKRGLVGYRCDQSGVNPVLPSDEDSVEPLDERLLLRLPIIVRSQELGSIEAIKPVENGPWTQEETSMMETLVDQLSVALDNARLYSETQLRAERERMISDITSKVRASTNLDIILQTSISELAQALHISQGRILIRGIGEVDDQGDRKDE